MLGVRFSVLSVRVNIYIYIYVLGFRFPVLGVRVSGVRVLYLERDICSMRYLFCEIYV